SPDAEMMAVDITLDPIDSPGVPHRLFQLQKEFPNDRTASLYDVRPDGQQFLIFMPTQRGTQDAPITVVLNWWAGVRQEQESANRTALPCHRQVGKDGRANATKPQIQSSAWSCRRRWEGPRSTWNTVGVDPPRRPVGDKRQYTGQCPKCI